jgi:glycosyltransferase involved in cell wall biosynthesis
LNWPDATLVIAGSHAKYDAVKNMVGTHGGGTIRLTGWVDKIEDFYASISLLCQPSASEGFGCEVLEAQANGRAVVCSEGAGAVDLVPQGCWRCPACDSDALVDSLQKARSEVEDNKFDARWLQSWQKRAEPHTWDKIMQRYVGVWRSMS